MPPSSRSHRNASCLVVLMLLFAVTQISAQEANTEDFLTDADLMHDLPLVNGAAHLPQRAADAPAAITIIDRRLIEASGAITPVELFRLVPGFQSYYVNGNRYGANYHASGDEYPRRMEVKVDGRPVYDPLVSAVEWKSLGLELEDIEYIEVVRGPNQAADGGNAFLGTINIVTRSPVANEGTAVRALVGYGNTRRFSAVHSAALGDVHNRITAIYERNDGFPDLPDEALNDGIKLGNLGYRGVWTPNLKDVVDIQAGYSQSENGIGGGGTGGEPSEVKPRDYKYTYQSISWQRDHSELHSIETLFYHNYSDVEDEPEYLGQLSDVLSDLTGIPPGALPIIFPGFVDYELPPMQLKAKTQRFDLEFRHIMTFNSHFQMNWGLAARYDRAKSERLFDSDDWIAQHNFRLFTNLEGRPSDWLTLNLGLMGEHNETVGNFLSPRFSTNFHFTPKQTIRLVASRGFRAPSLLESQQQQIYRGGERAGIDPDVQVISDPDIKKEKVTNLEIGYLGEFPNAGLTLDIKIFQEKLRDVIEEVNLKEDNDYIDEDILGGAVLRTNGIDLDTQGYEIGIDYRPIPQLLVAGQFSQVEVDGTQLQSTPPPLTYSLYRTLPEYAFDVLVNYTFPWSIDVGLNYFSQEATYWLQGDATERFERLDVRLAKDFKLGKTRTKVEFIVQNAFGNEYFEFHKFNDFERRAYLRIGVDW